MEILTLNSKVKIGCKICDKCCVYPSSFEVEISSSRSASIAMLIELTYKLLLVAYHATEIDTDATAKVITARYNEMINLFFFIKFYQFQISSRD